jgi:FKBP-type peptidyl-prolyl cis-trans isomerase FkpA
MRTFGTIAIALSLLVAAPAAAAGPELTTEDQKAIYALGLNIAQSLTSFTLTPAEIDLVISGLRDGLANTPKVDVVQYGQKLKEIVQRRTAAAADAEKKEAEGFLEKLAKEKGAEKTASGLIFIPVKAGSGSKPKATDTVKVHYKGTLRDGSVFDSSIERNEPAKFPLNRVIPCWTEGLQKMEVGAKAKLVCPASIAYGDRGAPPKIKPGAVLLFEVELLSIEPPAPAGASGTPAGHP